MKYSPTGIFKLFIFCLFIIIYIACDFIPLHNPFDEAQFNEPTVSSRPGPCEIRIMQGTTEILSDTGSYNIGIILINSNSNDISFQIQNLGQKDLKLTGDPKVSLSGSNVNAFNLLSQPQSPISPGNSSNFSLNFSPDAVGLFSITVNIANNDSNESSFTFAVTGTGTDQNIPDISITQGNTNINSGTGTYDFGYVQNGYSSSEEIFTIENTGTETLNLISDPNINISGSDADQFFVSQPALSSITVGNSAYFTLTFSPTSDGLKQATISIETNDDDENPFTFSVSGTGSSTPIPDISVKQGTDNINSGDGNCDLGSAQANAGTSSIDITIENSGSADLNLIGSPYDRLSYVGISGTYADQFSITQPTTASIAAGNTTDFSINFAPTSSGTKEATISISSNDIDENPYTFTVTGYGTSSPVAEMNISQDSTDLRSGTSTYDFGNVTTGSSSTTVTFSIENSGNANLELLGVPIVELNGTDADLFSVTQPSGSDVGPSSTVTFTIRFSPISIGEKSATISIANNDSDENPYTFTVIGTGTSVLVPELDLMQNSAGISDGGSYDFGNVQENTSSSQIEFTIENTGTGTLSLTGSPFIVLGGTNSNQFTVDTQPDSSSIIAGENNTFTLTFSPTSTGSKTATIIIANNDSNENPYSFTIKGTGTASPVPEIKIHKDSVEISDGSGSFDFGNVEEGTSSSSITFNIVNEGTGTLNLTGSPDVVLGGPNPGQFSITQPGTSAIPSSGSTTFTATFSPTNTGSKTATISIANNDSNENPYNFTITGTGTATPVPDIDMRQGSTNFTTGTSCYDFGSIQTGESGSAITFTIENNGSATLNLTGSPDVALSGTNADQFVLTQPGSSSITASNSTTFTITFSPTESGPLSATISITSNDSDENPFTFDIQGSGAYSGRDSDGDGDIDLTDLENFFSNYGSTGCNAGNNYCNGSDIDQDGDVDDNDKEDFALEMYSGISATFIAHWKFDDPNPTAPTTIVDSEGSYDGSYVSGTRLRAGVINNAINGDGSGDNGLLPGIGLNTFSIAFWFRSDDTSVPGGPDWDDGDGLVDGNVSGNANDFGISVLTNKVAFGIGESGSSGTTIISSTNILDNEWHHVVATRNGSTGAIKLYIDGTLEASGTGPTGARTDTGSNVIRLLAIATETNYLKARIDDLRIYTGIFLDDGYQE